MEIVNMASMHSSIGGNPVLNLDKYIKSAPDQYADGKAADVWEYYIGSKQTRTEQYRSWMTSLLRSRDCVNILDVACGTGIDSIMLLEEGFKVTSLDASDKMLKYALKERWNRRHEQAFDQWVIEEANWLTLVDDIELVDNKPEAGYDAVMCIGNSFAHLPDDDGKQTNQKLAIQNFQAVLKPGGVLIIDHRNFDSMIKTGAVPTKNIYYNSEYITGIHCYSLFVNGKPKSLTLNYQMNVPKLLERKTIQQYDDCLMNHLQNFSLSYYPHYLESFTILLKDIFGESVPYSVYADLQPLGSEKDLAAYLLHVIQKQN